VLNRPGKPNGAQELSGSGGQAARLLWMQAFNRASVLEAIRVVTNGIAPPPESVETKTGQTELELDMETRHTYAYLGRTQEAFGAFVVMLRPPAVATALVSPFDTGGCVGKIQPVCRWARERRNAFVKAFSWSGETFNMLSSEYPGPTESDCARYLNTSSRPTQTGPHEVWPKRFPPGDEMAKNGDQNIKTSAAVNGENDESATPMIWQPADNDWRCWTWEARWSGPVSSTDHLEHWACDSTTAQLVDKLLLSDELSDEQVKLISQRRYDAVGVSHAVEQYGARVLEGLK
jgi:hypothetical protein